MTAPEAGDPLDEAVRAALQSRADDTSELVREHVAWALAQSQPA